MVIKCLDNALYEGYSGVFSVFQYFLAYKRHSAHIKLTYKVGNFKYYPTKRGGLVLE